MIRTRTNGLTCMATRIANPASGALDRAGMNWNIMCAGCHNTRLRKNYDEGTDSYRTTMAEMTVGCESCHGPLKAHHEWQQQYGNPAAKTLPSQNFRVPRWWTTAGSATPAGRSHGDFKPGDAFFDHMRLSIVDATDTFTRTARCGMRITN